MDEATCRLTVYFEDPYWVGVYERSYEGKLEACRVVFGAEPKDFEVYHYFLAHWNRLRFGPALALDQKREASGSGNPKRMRRAIAKQLSQSGIGTKAQQALKLQREQTQLDRKAIRRRQSEEEKQRAFQLRQEKKKEKHRGR